MHCGGGSGGCWLVLAPLTHPLPRRARVRNRHKTHGLTHTHPPSPCLLQILTVIVDSVSLSTGAKTHGCLHLVDLAGSERTSKSEATGVNLMNVSLV